MAKREKILNKPEYINTFTGGNVQDITPEFQKNNTAPYAKDVRIIYNPNGSYSLNNEVGNTLLYQINNIDNSPMIPIGAIELPDKVVLFSVGVAPSPYTQNSEIGFIEIIDGLPISGTYTRCFNDFYDPNSELLNFKNIPDWFIKGISVVEAPDKQRVYWTDGNNEPRVFNVVAGLTANHPDFNNGDYQPIVSSGKYPQWYSVSQMAQMSDWGATKMNYVSRLGTQLPDGGAGSLLTGVYQLFCRMVTAEGYKTPWTVPSRRVFLTDKDYFATSDMHDFYMTVSGIPTPYALAFDVVGIDQRYYGIEVGYIFATSTGISSATASGLITEAKIFYTANLSDTTIVSNNLRVFLTANQGVPVDVDEFNDNPVWFKTVQDIVAKDQRLFECNITTQEDFKIDTSTITWEFINQDFVADALQGATNVPLTNVPIGVSPTYTVEKYIDATSTPVYESFVNAGEASSYQGMMYEWLFTGYWGSESYPFFLTLFNKKGVAFYAQLIANVRFPRRNDPSFPVATLDGSNNCHLHPMGIKFSGINIPKSIYGDVGSIQITRGDRNISVLCQGVVLDTVQNDDAVDPVVPTGTYNSPIFSGYTDGHTETNNVLDFNGQYPYRTSHPWTTRPYTFNFYSPDIAFGFDIFKQSGQPSNLPSDSFQIVTFNAATYNNNSLSLDHVVELTDHYRQFYNKFYNYDNSLSTYFGYKINSSSPLEIFLDAGGFGGDVMNYDPEAGAAPNAPKDFFGYSYVQFTTGGMLTAYGTRISKLIKLQGFASLLNTAANACEITVCNYVTGQNASAKSNTSEILSYSCGQMLATNNPYNPINPPSVTVDGVDCFQFNGLEVWGGDCWVNLFDFIKCYPAYSGDCTNTDFSSSLIIPLESNLNISLRKGRSFAADGTMPEQTSCSTDTVFPDGANINAPEEFNLNDVLLFREQVALFTSLPADFNFQNVFSDRWVYSELKIYGEQQDMYRTFLPDSFADVIGAYGSVTGGVLWMNQLYSFQQRGWGRLLVNDKSYVQDQNTQAIQTGVGSTISPPNVTYFTHESGCQNKFAMLSTDRGIYYYDNIKQSFYSYGGSSEGVECTSDLKGQRNALISASKIYNNLLENSPVAPFYRLAYNPQLHDVWICFFGGIGSFSDVEVDNATPPFDVNFNGISIIFNEDVGNFVQWKSWSQNQLFGHKNNFISFNALDNNLYLENQGNYGQFFGSYLTSIVAVVVNPEFNKAKKIDNAILNINEDGSTLLDRIDMVLDSLPNYSVQNIQSDTRVIYRNNNFYVQTMAVSDSLRPQGKYAIIYLSFINADDKLINFTSLKTYWRLANLPG